MGYLCAYFEDSDGNPINTLSPTLRVIALSSGEESSYDMTSIGYGWYRAEVPDELLNDEEFVYVGLSNDPTVDDFVGGVHYPYSRYKATPLGMVLAMEQTKYLTSLEATKPLEFFRGDSVEITFAVYDANGDPVDISETTGTFSIKQDDTDTEYVLQKPIELLGGNEGKISLTAAETEIPPLRYIGDIQLVFPPGPDETTGAVRTIWKGEVKVKADITR
ncbi:hypothetical protein J7K18_03460 [bacterium]|nr:hypothetical protein [bacterium]